MDRELTNQVVETIKSAASKLTRCKRGEYMAEVVLAYCNGSPCQAERRFGWGRKAVNTTLQE